MIDRHCMVGNMPATISEDFDENVGEFDAKLFQLINIEGESEWASASNFVGNEYLQARYAYARRGERNAFALDVVAAVDDHVYEESDSE